MPSYALIAEPDPGQAQTLRHIVAAEGFDPKMVRDGDGALGALRALGPPSLTIIEPALASVDGFKIIEEIRRMATADKSPIIVISAFRNIRDTASQLRDELGINALLARSSPIDSVRRAIKKVLAASAAPHAPARGADLDQPRDTRTEEVDEDRAEELRLHHLDQMDLVTEKGDEQETELKRIVEDVAKRFEVPIAAISLVLDDKQWFKASVGTTGSLAKERGGPRDWSFCQHVVQGRQPLVVPDAAVHPTFAQNPLVQDGTLRSYAGAPLEAPSGDVLGSLCIIDTKPLAITADDVDDLVILARLVAGELELRSEKKRQEKERASLAPEMKAALQKDKPLYDALSYLSAVLANIDSGVFLLDPERRVVFANQALADMFGHRAESLIGKHRDALLRDAAQQFADPDEFLRRLRTHKEGPYALRGQFEMDKPRRRVIRWTTKPVQLGEGVGHLTVLTDVTAEVDLLHEREQLARTDAVTGLMNRRGAEEVLEREAARAQRFGSRVSVVLIDVDHFKRVNDTKGHATGDDVLRAIAGILSRAMRGVDVAARWGGDELVAILPATGLEGARSFGERVRAAVEALDPAKYHHVTISAGTAELQPGEDGAEAVRRADVQLYEAKDAGRNRVA